MTTSTRMTTTTWTTWTRTRTRSWTNSESDARIDPIPEASPARFFSPSRPYRSVDPASVGRPGWISVTMIWNGGPDRAMMEDVGAGGPGARRAGRAAPESIGKGATSAMAAAENRPGDSPDAHGPETSTRRLRAQSQI